VNPTPRNNELNGLVLVDKPQGCTSHDVVNRWRKLARTKRAGHLGTLDPMATGLLLLVTGNATRLARFFEKQEKTYEAEIRFGYVSDTYDAEGTVEQTGAAIPGREQVRQAVECFRGSFLQTPPAVSAKKVNGVAAYKLARKQQHVELAPVLVTVTSLVLHELSDDAVRIQVVCSAGTYIRSIAHDLGAALGCGAILTALRRTGSGNFCVTEALPLERLQSLADEQRLGEALIPATKLLPDFPTAYVDQIAEAQIRQGRDFRTSPFSVKPGAPFVKAISTAGELVSIGELKFPNVYHPMMVL
jgi:tRNA pseudouridine55 synthase